MRNRWAALQLAGFVVAGLALVAPDPARLARHWSDATIYPWWAALYVALGALAALASLLLRDRARALVASTLSVVMAAQLAGLGLVAVKHWRPSFGMGGGGYAGEIEDLARLAWVLATAGVVAAVAAVAQLVDGRAFPVPARGWAAFALVGTGALVLLLLPFGIAEGEGELQDTTSLGAFVLIYSAPLGLVTAGTAWLAPRLRPVALGSCAAAAGLSALDLVTDLTFHHGRPALLVTTLVLGALTAVSVATARTPQPVGGYRENKNVF